jgi:hydroxyacylglutathione hydrolase
MLPLEDNFNDVIGKAQRGHNFSDDQLAKQAGISVDNLNRVKNGEFDELAVTKLAGPLKLGAKTLVQLGKKAWHPKDPGHIDGLAMFTTTYGDMTVNSYLVWDTASKEAFAFDTGADSTSMVQKAKELGLTIKMILITHTHVDHIADLENLKKATGAKAYVCELEAFPGTESFPAGRKFSIGRLQLETRQTSGHARGGITYVIAGLSKPLAIVGDSIFASSMGGGMISYADALRNNREKILTLPNETVICSGHGPLTTVGEEKQNNPFFT